MQDPCEGGFVVTHVETLSLTQFTGRARPATGTRALSTGLVAGGSVLTQTALPTVCSVKTCRAFWEEKRTHTHTHG